VCTRQRTFGLFAVCTRTAKGPRVAQLCSWELLGGVPAWFFAVRGRARPHGKASHGKHCCARQRRAHGKEVGRTAKQRRTAAMATHGKDPSHGSVRSARQRWRRTAKGVAVQSVHAHGKGSFAVEDFAVQTMPCVHARQSLCRAYRPLCRPMARTAKPVSPVVLPHVAIIRAPSTFQLVSSQGRNAYAPCTGHPLHDCTIGFTQVSCYEIRAAMFY
jgi:hypothetical protein